MRNAEKQSRRDIGRCRMLISCKLGADTCKLRQRRITPHAAWERNMAMWQECLLIPTSCRVLAVRSSLIWNRIWRQPASQLYGTGGSSDSSWLDSTRGRQTGRRRLRGNSN